MPGSPVLHYAYTHTVTESTTGYFSCEPEPALTLPDVLAHLHKAPMDEFMHRHALRRLTTMDLTDLQALAKEQGESPVLRALLLECALLHANLAPLRALFPENAVEQSLAFTPLPHLAWSLRKDRALHSAWSLLFAANITAHEKLPHPEEEELPLLPLLTQNGEKTKDAPSLTELHATFAAAPGPAWSRPPAQETALRALELLVENAVMDGVEMRHEASLSPIALLRPWQVDIAVESGPLHYSLKGKATTYGRGLSLADARASYSMEMVERASSYASVKDNIVQGLSRHTPLFKARYSELVSSGKRALDPNALPLEAPYTDAPLYWMEAVEAGTEDCVLVPAQSVFLFCNLDEPALFMNPGSTGLASGNSLAEAKTAALTEILERDAEAVMPYHRSRCFTLRSTDPRLQSLLDDYKARGIHVHFLDLTTEFGLPCYQAFVMGRKGEIHRATGANLNGARAIISALTEVPYPYPGGPASGPAIKGLPECVLEELPNYSLESPTRNVALLENILQAHGHTPLYVEISREDLEFPVVRALIPGLELSAELDSFSKISQRLFANYLQLFA